MTIYEENEVNYDDYECLCEECLLRRHAHAHAHDCSCSSCIYKDYDYDPEAEREWELMVASWEEFENRHQDEDHFLQEAESLRLCAETRRRLREHEDLQMERVLRHEYRRMYLHEEYADNPERILLDDAIKRGRKPRRKDRRRNEKKPVLERLDQLLDQLNEDYLAWRAYLHVGITPEDFGHTPAWDFDNEERWIQATAYFIDNYPSADETKYRRWWEHMHLGHSYFNCRMATAEAQTSYQAEYFHWYLQRNPDQWEIDSPEQDHDFEDYLNHLRSARYAVSYRDDSAEDNDSDHWSDYIDDRVDTAEEIAFPE